MAGGEALHFSTLPLMVRITDTTLSCIDNLPHNKSDISRFLAFLIEMEIDTIELSRQMRQLLSPLPNYAFCVSPRKRVYLRGDALCDNYLQIFAKIKKNLGENIEFCPVNSFHCATALAAEWAINGMGNKVVSSFGGIGNLAATEELVMILRMNGLRKAEKTYKFLPEMTKLFCKITGKNARQNKPIIGKRIFNVESGIHVDGILKSPECYEPFQPEIVGQKRKIVLGKQSGKASIKAMFSELNMQCAEKHIPHILEKVKARALAKNGAVTKREFAEIVSECLA
jgi:homocitrate synthase NifV